jgi:ADP-dependent NAD(P)H-hydrate dehydratase / NAD(P)H-hydrate epimerase
MSVNGSLPRELYRAEQVRELDRRAIEDGGTTGYALMNRAGAAAYAALHRQWPRTRSIVAVCGAGNNAGDGYVIARLAHEHGLAATVMALVDPARLGGDARRAWQDALAAGIEVLPFDATGLADADVIVDAVFGTGLSRPVEGEWRAAIEAINAAPAPVLAVDIPSGLMADTGAILGAAIHATLTISFIGLKQGLFTGQGPDCCGIIVFDDLAVPHTLHIGLEPAAHRYGGEDRAQWLAPRARAAHKGDFGHVLVIGGDHGFAGAARMAAEAAARSGAGLVSVATRPEHAVVQAALRPEIMFRGVADPNQLQPLLARASVLAIGPGLGQGDWGQSLLDAGLAYGKPLVLDADALNLLARIPGHRDDWILTPHPGEAARLLDCDTATVQRDRFAAVRQLVQRYGGVILLKGAGTLIAEAGQSPDVIDAGNPGMASGGMGDVLTGIIAGLLAQGLAPAVATRLGAWLHATAADRAATADGERGLLATDLLCELRALVNPDRVHPDRVHPDRVHP